MKKRKIDGQKIISLNRKANFNYFLHDLYEAGIRLRGSEVKSLRTGKINISDSYAIDKKGEIYLINSHIPLYRQSSYNNHHPRDDRKLLLKKKEINKLIGKIHQEGLTIVPTKIYFKKGKAKVQLAIGKGKKKYDKRVAKKNRDWNRDKARYVRRSS